MGCGLKDGNLARFYWGVGVGGGGGYLLGVMGT